MGMGALPTPPGGRGWPHLRLCLGTARTPLPGGGPSSLSPWKDFSTLESALVPLLPTTATPHRGRPPGRRGRVTAVSWQRTPPPPRRPGHRPKLTLHLQKGGMLQGPGLQVCPDLPAAPPDPGWPWAPVPPCGGAGNCPSGLWPGPTGPESHLPSLSSLLLFLPFLPLVSTLSSV